LGASLFTGQRAAERADVFLARVDHQRLAARLADQEEMIGFSARARKEAESIESEIAAVAQVASRRRALAGSAADAEPVIASLEGITRQDITAARARIVKATTMLDDAVTSAAAHLNPLCYKPDAHPVSAGVYRHHPARDALSSVERLKIDLGRANGLATSRSKITPLRRAYSHSPRFGCRSSRVLGDATCGAEVAVLRARLFEAATRVVAPMRRSM